STTFTSCSLVDKNHKSQNNNPVQYYGGQNFGIVISGPSGVGKTTIVNELMKRNPEIILSRSVTTRKPRRGEINGIDYNFITQAEFNEMKNSGQLLESVSNYNNSYGTPLNNYYDALDNQQDIVFVVDSYGMMSMKKNKDIDVLTIFIAPPSIDELSKRLAGRGSESKDSFNKRISAAQEEMKNAVSYDYVVYNCDLQDAVKIVDAIYKSEKYKRFIKGDN
ncbi:MAG: guanylate kinase, partial [Pseudomonadota bacterium]